MCFKELAGLRSHKTTRMDGHGTVLLSILRLELGGGGGSGAEGGGGGVVRGWALISVSPVTTVGTKRKEQESR